MAKKGYLVLENGEIFPGLSFGLEKEVFGEVVFNTGMVGYPEGLTDPSYFGQIVVFTYPLIGNYGVPPSGKNQELEFWESERIQVRGLIVSSYIPGKNHWQAKETLATWLKREKIPALYGVDTRTLTKILRSQGVMKGAILFRPPSQNRGVSFLDINQENLVAAVSCRQPLSYGSGKIKILLLDCGVKFSQIKFLLSQGVSVIRVPWDYDPFENSLQFDGILVSNGPGDPQKVRKTIFLVRKALERKIPTFGICLGNQILALAAGAKTYKLKYGHRGQNQPVKDLKSGRAFITTQNHGYAVEEKSLPSGWCPWFKNLNDGTNEGIFHQRFPFFSVQFHPEAAPGPTDTAWLFAYFVETIKKYGAKKIS